MTRVRTIYVALYIAVIVIANWMTATIGLVSIGFGLVVTAGTFAAGAALILRDGVQVHAGRKVLFPAIAVGAIVSAVTSTPALAVASGIAFAVSELVDTGVFTPLRDKSLAGAVVISSIVSAPIDTVLFLWIAGFPVTWQAILGQFLVKTTLALIVALFISVRGRRDVPVRV
jgi:uncharacterized PurR-regulated membrane protein YhhQ (DUF165 family)